MENGYQVFKNMAKRRRWMVDSSVDDETLKSKLSNVLSKTEVDNMLYSQDMYGNEVLDEFKKRFIQESSLPKEQKGFIRKSEAQGKKLSLAEERVVKTEGKISGTYNKSKTVNENINQLDGFIKDLKGRRKDIFDNLKLIRDIKTNKVDYQKNGFERISYFNNGVKEDWLIPDDVGSALKNLGGDEANKVMSWLNNSLMGKIVSTPANVLRKVATTANPVFALVRNPARDAQTALLTAGDDYAKGLIKTITGRHDEQLYRLARESGALQGSIYREQLKPEQIIAEKAKEKSGIVKKILRPDKLIEGWGQKMEEMTRMSVFSGALKNGKTTEEAAKLARNATVDFGKSGNTMQVLNKLIPFLNARVQGFANMGKAILKDPAKATRVLMWSAAYPQAVLTAYNSKYDSYESIPDYEKRKYWIVMVGETNGRDLDNKKVKVPNYIKVPKGEAQQAVSNIVERVLTIGNKKYPDSTGQFLANLVGDISPVTESSLIPTGLQQAIELKTNYSIYKGKPIESDYTKIKNKWFKTDEIEPRYRTGVNTSQFAKVLGNVMNWSPVKIDYVAKTGVIGDIINAFDIPVKLSDKKKTPFEKVSSMPIASGVVGSSYWGTSQEKKVKEKQETQDKNTKKIKRYLK